MRALSQTATLVAVASALSCGDTSHLVVDPMPPPARCAGSPPDVPVNASLVTAADGALEVMVLLGPSPSGTASYVDAAPTVDVGQVVYWRITAQGLEVRLRGKGVINANIPLRCADGSGAVIARIVIPPEAAAGDAVEVKLAPQY